MESILYLHFETTYDAACMQKMLAEELEQQTFDQFLTFHQKVRNRFARMFLFATQVCHLIVFVELSVTFDASLLGVFKSLKIIRFSFEFHNNRNRIKLIKFFVLKGIVMF